MNNQPPPPALSAEEMTQELLSLLKQRRQLWAAFEAAPSDSEEEDTQDESLNESAQKIAEFFDWNLEFSQVLTTERIARQQAERELESIRFASKMPDDYKHGLTSWVNTLYLNYIGLKISDHIYQDVITGRLTFPESPAEKRVVELERELAELKAALRTAAPFMDKHRVSIEEILHDFRKTYPHGKKHDAAATLLRAIDPTQTGEGDAP